MREFYQQISERKSLVPSAKHKRNGSKTKFVSLPHDGMTERQWRKMNGDVITYNLNKPISWNTLKTMPADLVKEYIENLQKNYNATLRDIAKCMSVTDGTLYKYLRTINSGIHFPKGRSSSDEDKERLSNFYGVPNIAGVQITPVEDEPIVHVEAEVEGDVEVEPANRDVEPDDASEPVRRMDMTEFTLTFNGSYDEQMVVQSLRMILGVGAECEMVIAVKKRGV